MLDTQELNLDDLEEDTRKAITQARTVLGEIQGNMKRFRVRYSSTASMITAVLAESEEKVTEEGIVPGVYDVIPDELIPKYIEKIQNFDYAWIEADDESES